MQIHTIDLRRNWRLILEKWGITSVCKYTSIDAIQDGDIIIVHVSDCSSLVRDNLINKKESITLSFLIVTGDDKFPEQDWIKIEDSYHSKCLTQVPYFQIESDLNDGQRIDLKEIVRMLVSRAGEESPFVTAPTSGHSEISRPLGSSADVITSLIHRLKNLFSPVLLDADTLRVRNPNIDETTLRDVFQDHFMSGESAYLGERSTRHGGTEIVHYIETLCASLPKPITSDITEKMALITAAVKEARQAYQDDDSRDIGAVELPSISDLQEKLEKIAEAGDALVEALREIRKKKQGVIN